MLANPQGRISTFYSYKGGTGRTMALANVAWVLASNGKRVLAIDWDLEAPGLHRYFAPLLGDPKLASSPGLIDFLLEYWIAATHPVEDDDDPRWFERYADLAGLALPVLADFPKGGRLDLVGAGQQDGGYAERVTSFDWKAFYASFGGAGFLDLTFERLRLEYDYILIDSRTGVSDTAGICTVQLPDSLVVFFTLNNQSIEGASAIAHDALTQRQGLGRARLAVFPVPSRIDLFERDKLELRRSLVRERFTDLLDLDDAARQLYFADIELLYVPFYSYEEQLATIIDRPNQHASLLGSFERLTGHVSGGEVSQLVAMSDALRADFRAKYDAFHRAELPRQGSGPEERWDIFLSYAFEDRETAAALYRQLQPRFKTFFDVEEISAGQNIAETIVRAAANSRITVILLSRAALASDSFADEIEQVLAGQIATRKSLHAITRVLPVLIGVEADDLPERLARLRDYRATSVPASRQAAHLAAEAIAAALGEKPPSGSENASPSPASERMASPVGATAHEPTQASEKRPPSDTLTDGRVEASPPSSQRLLGFVIAALSLALLVSTGLLVQSLAGGPDPVGVGQDEGAGEDGGPTMATEDKLALDRERGLRASLLAEDHSRIIEALVLGVQAVGAYDTETELPPTEASTGLLAALTQVSGDATLRYTLPGHRNGISILRYAKGGSAIASVDGAGVVRVWDASKGALTATLNKDGPAPSWLAIADDGSQVAWNSGEGVQIWRASSGDTPVERIPCKDEVRDLTFWDQGATLAVATNRSLSVYDIETKTSLDSKGLGVLDQIALTNDAHRFAFEKGTNVEVFGLLPVSEKKPELRPTRVSQFQSPGSGRLQMLPGGDHVLYSSQNAVVIQASGGPPARVLLESSLTTRPLIATADAEPVVAVAWTDDLTVQVWSAARGSRSFRAATEGIASLALAGNGSRLAVLDRSGTIQIWELDSLSRLTTIVAGKDEVDTLTFSPQGKQLVVGSSDGTARAWNLRQRRTWNIADPSQPIRDLDVGAELLVTANDDQVIRVWDLQRGRELIQIPTLPAVTALALVRSEGAGHGAIVTASAEGPARLLDIDGRKVLELLGSPTDVHSLAFSSRGDLIALGDGEGVVHLWDHEGSRLESLAGSAAAVDVLAFASDGRRLASGQDQKVEVWTFDPSRRRAPTMQSFDGHQSSVRSLAFSPTGRWIGSSSSDTIARLWDLEAPQDERARTFEGHGAPLTAIAFSSDDFVVTASEDATARVWALDGETSVVLAGHSGPIRALALTPKGWIVTASDDGTARIWTREGVPIATFVGHRTGLVSAMLTPDGELLVTASADGDLRLWPTSPSAWLRAGCEELSERAEADRVTKICQRFSRDKPTRDYYEPSPSSSAEVWEVEAKALPRPKRPAPDPTGKPH